MSSHFDFGFIIFYGPPYVIKWLDIFILPTNRDTVAHSQNDTLCCQNTNPVKTSK